MKISKALTILAVAAAVWCGGKYLIADNWHAPADDFTSLYVAARLLADGNDGSLYDHHPLFFDIVPPGGFAATAREIGCEGFLHPYLHIPLVAFLLRPLLSVSYDTAAAMLLLLNVLSLAASLFLMARILGEGNKPIWFVLSCLAAIYYYPVRYGISLGQTSPLVYLGIAGLYYLVRGGHEKSAGVILGGIISLKITPLLLVIFFMARRRWATVLSCAVTLLLISIASLAAAGWESNQAFLENLFRLSGLSLASWNNQSLDGFLLRLVRDRSYVSSWQLLTLPEGMTILKWCVSVGLIALWLKLLLAPVRPGEQRRDLLDFSLTLILMTVLPPISWSHYYIVLLFPYGVLVREVVRSTTMPYRGLMTAALLLSYMCVSLPPAYLGITDPLSYFEFLAGFPPLTRLPLWLKSSFYFLGAVLLLIIVVAERVRVGRTPGYHKA